MSSWGGDPNSCMLYTRTKGEAEEELRKKGLNLLTILKPGLLIGRRDARCGESFLACLCCCCPTCIGIEARKAVEVMKKVAEKHREEASNSRGVVQVLENSDMVALADQ